MGTVARSGLGEERVADPQQTYRRNTALENISSDFKAFILLRLSKEELKHAEMFS